MTAMEYGCIGEKLSYSFSAEIHGALGYAYELKELKKEELSAFFAARDFRGVNVTAPYKRAVMPLLDEIDPAARAIGAVNTVVNKCGKLYGHNTDFYGLKRLAERVGVPLKNKKAIVLGSGGTAQTAKAVCRASGAKEILVVSRRKKDGCITYEELYALHSDGEYLIDTTPCGTTPDESRAADLAKLPCLRAVLDVAYNPLRSPLVLQAESLKIPSEGGMYMLIAQAVKASELFLDKTYPNEKTDELFETLREKKRNVVLCGMPSSGKTTLGEELCRLTGRDFYDTDRMIVEKTGRTIPEIFESEGEGAFRAYEREAVKEVSRKSGVIVATGGGAVLFDENVNRLKANGALVLLDRPLQDLVSSGDRPLAATKAALEKIFYERRDRYFAAADKIVPVDGAPQDTAKRILEMLRS